jgi:hypothetical protein
MTASKHVSRSEPAAVSYRASPPETNTRHPYEVPSVIAVPILDGSPAYLEWIRSETGPEPVSNDTTAKSELSSKSGF